MEQRAAASKFSAGFGVFAPPASKAEKDRYSLIGAVALAGVIVVMGVASRYIGFGDEDDRAAFLDDSPAHSIPAVRHSPTYRRESMDYLIPAEDAAREEAPSGPALSDAVAEEPASQSLAPAALPAQRHRHPRHRVLALGFKGGSGLSGGIGKSFQPIMRQPMTEGASAGGSQ